MIVSTPLFTRCAIILPSPMSDTTDSAMEIDSSVGVKSAYPYSLNISCGSCNRRLSGLSPIISSHDVHDFAVDDVDSIVGDDNDDDDDDSGCSIADDDSSDDDDDDDDDDECSITDDDDKLADDTNDIGGSTAADN